MKKFLSLSLKFTEKQAREQFGIYSKNREVRKLMLPFYIFRAKGEVKITDSNKKQYPIKLKNKVGYSDISPYACYYYNDAGTALQPLILHAGEFGFDFDVTRLAEHFVASSECRVHNELCHIDAKSIPEGFELLPAKIYEKDGTLLPEIVQRITGELKNSFIQNIKRVLRTKASINTTGLNFFWSFSDLRAELLYVPFYVVKLPYFGQHFYHFVEGYTGQYTSQTPNILRDRWFFVFLLNLFMDPYFFDYRLRVAIGTVSLTAALFKPYQKMKKLSDQAKKYEYLPLEDLFTSKNNTAKETNTSNTHSDKSSSSNSFKFTKEKKTKQEYNNTSFKSSRRKTIFSERIRVKKLIKDETYEDPLGYYSVLGLTSNSVYSDAEVKQAYLKMVKLRHPDRYQDEIKKEQANTFLKKLNEALSNLETGKK